MRWVKTLAADRMPVVLDASNHPPHSLTALLTRLRFRLIGARLIDASVPGVVAAVLGVSLNLIGGSAIPPLLLFVMIVVVITALPLARLPSLVATAARLDDILRLNDLLCSALLTRDRDDDWCRLIRCQAEHALQSRAAPRFMRFGLRVHAACWLLACALLVAASIGRSLQSPASDAQAPAIDQRAGLANGSAVRTSLGDPSGVRAREAQSEMRGADHNAPQANGAGTTPPRASAGADARGAGRADSDAHGNDAAPRDLANHGRSGSPGAADRLASGSGRAANTRGTPGTSNGGASVTSAPPAPVAPWQTDAWSQRRDDARAAVDSGRIPDAYRALVRDYFDR